MQVQVRFKKSAFTICTLYIIHGSFSSFKIMENTAFPFFHEFSCLLSRGKQKLLKKFSYKVILFPINFQNNSPTTEKIS